MMPSPKLTEGRPAPAVEAGAEAAAAFAIPDAIILTSAAQVLQEGLSALQRGIYQFDFSALKVCDSSAVAVCVQWRTAAAAAGKVWSALNVPDNLKNLAEVYEIDTALFAPSLAPSSLTDAARSAGSALPAAIQSNNNLRPRVA